MKITLKVKIHLLVLFLVFPCLLSINLNLSDKKNQHNTIKNISTYQYWKLSEPFAIDNLGAQDWEWANMLL
ncbi:MAG: hypothetical protein ACFFAS_16280 [Promethearchaeota archaeon]